MYRVFVAFLLSIFTLQVAYAAPSPKDFGELPAVYDAAISPNGSEIAMFYNIKGTYGIRIVSLEGEKPKSQLVLLGEGVKPRWLKWANDDCVLTSVWQSSETDDRRKTGTKMKSKSLVYTATFLHSFNVRSMERIVLAKPKNIFRQFNDDVVDFLEDDPDHILMSFSKVNAFAPDIHKVNVATGKTSKVENGNEKIQYWYTDLTGTPRIAQGRKDNTHEEEWTLRVKSHENGEWENSDVYPGLDADADIFGFTKNRNELIIGSYAGEDTKGLYIYDLKKKKQTRKLFHHDVYDVQNVVLNASGDDVIGAGFVSDEKEIELFDAYDTSTLDRVRGEFPGYRVDYIDQSQTGNSILLKVSGPNDPGALLLVNESPYKVTPLVNYREKLPANEMGEVISVKYTARDGFSVPAFVTLPRSITQTSQLKGLPFIVLPHGGPYARDSKRFDYFAQFFASKGFGVLQMNFRGSSGYGKTFEDAGRKNWIVMQEDVEDGTRWLIEKGYADPSRVCIFGWSYGGYAALMGAIKNPELYACSASIAGVTNIQDMISDMKKYRFGQLSAQNFILQGFSDKDAIKENSPVHRAEEFSVPVFLAHGEEDQRVHFDQYLRMKRGLKKSSAKTTFMEFRNEDHFLSQQKNRQDLFVGIDKFLNKTVGPSEFALK